MIQNIGKIAYRCRPGPVFNADVRHKQLEVAWLDRPRPVLNALVGWCPAYGSLGVNTCPTENHR